MLSVPVGVALAVGTRALAAPPTIAAENNPEQREHSVAVCDVLKASRPDLDPVVAFAQSEDFPGLRINDASGPNPMTVLDILNPNFAILLARTIKVVYTHIDNLLP